MSQATSHLAHHFDDPVQQKDSATLGMWIFLATEVMLFGAIFTGYIIYRRVYYDGFVIGSNHLYVTLGTLNTVVLITSSLLMALAVNAAHHGNSKGIARYISITVALGMVFLCIKSIEYHLDYRDGLIPWGNWWFYHAHGEVLDRQVKLFFVFYFIMTLLHAIHMTIGMCVLAAIALMARNGKFNSQYYTPVEIAGLYWHFVDVVWVFLFPTLYLVNAAMKLQSI